MANLLKILVTVGVLAALAGEAHAVALNRCIRVVQNPQVNTRETLVNTCQQCIMAKVERRRPGTASGVPSMREFNMPGGSSMPLPFQGPGRTRITSELPCPSAQ